MCTPHQTRAGWHCLCICSLLLKWNQQHVVADCRSASDIESPDKENDASDQLAARFAGLQLIQHRTPAKPVQTARPFLSVPPKMPGSHHRQAGAASPAFRKQRESLAYEMFHEYDSHTSCNELHALCLLSQCCRQSALGVQQQGCQWISIICHIL